MDAPQWRTVLTWIREIIKDHAKVSWERKNINGQVPAAGVYDILKSMAKAADSARELFKENERLKAELKQHTINKTAYHELRNRIANLNHTLSDDDFMTLDHELPSLLSELCNIEIDFDNESPLTKKG